jgi:hypothetical protein
MPARLVYSDDQLLAFSREHLLYEFHMFRWLAENMPSDKGFPMSVSLESFAIHLRNLIDFFYKEPQPPDDVAALDFYDPPTGWAPGAMSATLEVARERANKEISHITFKRKSGVFTDKPWAVGALFNEIHAVAQKFAAGASPKKLHADVITWLNSPPAMTGHGEADYLLFVDGAPIGVVEAKKEGDTLTGVELQTTK